MIGKRGRPLGFRMSEESKMAIRESKKGQRHKQITKDKISRTLIIYFRNKNPLSEELTREYCTTEEDEFLYNWLIEVQDEIDSIQDVRTERSMRNSRRIELNYGQNIEYFSHTMTPETLVLFKEFYEDGGLTGDDIFDILAED